MTSHLLFVIAVNVEDRVGNTSVFSLGRVKVVRRTIG